MKMMHLAIYNILYYREIGSNITGKYIYIPEFSTEIQLSKIPREQIFVIIFILAIQEYLKRSHHQIAFLFEHVTMMSPFILLIQSCRYADSTQGL